jgi:hypothetical protein
MEHNIRINLLGAVATLVLGVGASVVASTMLATRAYRARVDQIERADQAVTVKGFARTPIRSDQAVWAIDVSGRGDTLPATFAQLEEGVARAREFLLDAGFGDGAIALSPIETTEYPDYDQHGRATLKIRGYAMKRTLTVSTPEVERVAHAAGAVTGLLEQGVSLISRPPEYTYSALADTKVDIVGRASADARHRAEAIATEAGAALAEVRFASQGVMQVTTPGSTSVSGYGIYDTSTIDKEASIVVTVTFGLAG